MTTNLTIDEKMDPQESGMVRLSISKQFNNSEMAGSRDDVIVVRHFSLLSQLSEVGRANLTHGGGREVIE